MTEDYTIQCENCGALYDEVEEACPTCGLPNPLLLEEPSFVPDGYAAEQAPDEYDENFYEWPEDSLLYDDPLHSARPGLPEDVYPDIEGVYDQPEAVLEDDRLTPDNDITLDGELSEYGWLAEQEAFERDYGLYGGYGDYPEPAEEEQAPSRRPTWSRMVVGCLGLFVCIGVLYGTVALVAAYNGLRERASNTQVKAEQHYQRGQDHLTNNQLDLAVAEFEMALSLNPNFIEARQALREAQSVIESKPTATSETRSAAAADILKKAEEQLQEKDWFEVAQTLAQVRDLDPDYQAKRVSDLLYTANYELGLQLVSGGRIEEAVTSFERAVAERPGDAAAADELDKAALYLEGEAAEVTDWQKAVDTFSLLYRKDPDYLDVEDRLAEAHLRLGDELAAGGDWCLAEVQYLQAADIQPADSVTRKLEASNRRCQEEPLVEVETTPSASSTPTVPAAGTASADSPASGSPAAAVESSPAETPTTEAVQVQSGGGQGSIIYSAYNPFEKRWEILSVPAGGGSPRLLVADGTMPAMSPDGRSIVYHSERLEAEGFHRYDFATAEDVRITLHKHHILPRWAGDSKEFIFVAEEPGTGRWQIHLGYADGKSDPVILRDGRTPDWSPDKSLIAYQGTDPAGNLPGIYIVPYGGGEAERLTTHQSDRSPDFSPDGSRLAYMSTEQGNWQIYTVGVSGGAPRQVTTGAGNHGLPRWSPDGSQIAFVSDREGSWAIYVIAAEGGQPRRVVNWDALNRSDWLLDQIDWAP